MEEMERGQKQKKNSSLVVYLTISQGNTGKSILHIHCDFFCLPNLWTLNCTIPSMALLFPTFGCSRLEPKKCLVEYFRTPLLESLRLDACINVDNTFSPRFCSSIFPIKWTHLFSCNVNQHKSAVSHCDLKCIDELMYCSWKKYASVDMCCNLSIHQPVLLSSNLPSTLPGSSSGCNQSRARP